MKRLVGLTIAALILASAFLSFGSQEASKLSPADARKIISDGNVEWGKARVALDKPTFERMLAPDFYVQLQDRKLTRQEFIDGISSNPPGLKLTRFDASVLTVRPEKDGTWVALIHEKLEFERLGRTIYTLWITRDGWKLVDGRWRILFSEEMGSEWWAGGIKPPFPNW
jgi:hypothetical protein